MPESLPLDAAQIEAFLIATGIGLLIGLERERVPSARAGLRTFALVGMLGALMAMLGEQLGSFAPFVAGMVIVALTIIAAYLRQPDPSDPSDPMMTEVSMSNNRQYTGEFAARR